MSVAKQIDELTEWISDIPVSLDTINYTLSLLLLLLARVHGDEELKVLAERNFESAKNRLERWWK